MSTITLQDILEQQARTNALIAQFAQSQTAETTETTETTETVRTPDHDAYDMAVLWRKLVEWAQDVPNFAPDRAIIMTGTVRNARKHARNFDNEREAVQWFKFWLDAGETFKHDYVRTAQRFNRWEKADEDIKALFGVPTDESHKNTKHAPSQVAGMRASADFADYMVGKPTMTWDTIAGTFEYERMPKALNLLATASKNGESLTIVAPSKAGTSARVMWRVISGMLFDSGTAVGAIDYALVKAHGYAPIVRDGRTYGYYVNSQVGVKPKTYHRLLTNDLALAKAATVGHIAPTTNED